MNLSTLINDGFFAYTMYQTARQPKFYVHLPWKWRSPPAKLVIRNACMVGYSGMFQLLRMSNIMWQAETLREALPPNIPVDVYALALSFQNRAGKKPRKYGTAGKQIAVRTYTGKESDYGRI